MSSLLLAAVWCGFGALAQEEPGQEEREDYYRKWLEEDVAYIITDEERAVFKKLGNADEKDQFIEQFWHRRDPDYSTSANEFKEEHYRRIAYANEHFASGLEGWRTDRGRVYIIHGPPAERERHPNGGSYQRPRHEGGGITQALPFEIWRYRYVEGVGQDVILEFVDPTGSGEYRLALNPEEKDAFLTQRGSGLTTAEELGLAQRRDRPAFSPDNRDKYPFASQRVRDNPFIRYERNAQMLAPAPIRYNDLKRIVDVDVGYATLPLRVRADYFRLNESRHLVPISLELENRELSFQPSGDDTISATVAVYGIVTSIRNRIVTEFDDDLVVDLGRGRDALRHSGRSVYQRMIQLDPKLRYKLDLVVKDLNSGKVGVVQKALLPPSHEEGELGVSSVMLSDYIAQLSDLPDGQEMFVIGDVKVRPSLSNRFRRDRSFGVYLHVYGAELDQAGLEPSLSVRYRVLRQGEALMESADEAGESIQFFSGQRVVLVKGIPLSRLEPGDYRLAIEIEDRVGRKSAQATQNFTVEEPVAASE